MLNILCNIDVINYFSDLTPNAAMGNGLKFFLHLTEAPLSFAFTDEADTMKVDSLLRFSTLPTEETNDTPRATAVFDKATEQIEVTVNDDDDGIETFFKACCGIAQLIADNDLEDVGEDDEEDFVLVSLEDDGLNVEVVSGDERPDIMCFNVIEQKMYMGRPYSEDFFGSFFQEMEDNGKSLEDFLAEAEEGDVHAMEKVAEAYENGDDEVDEDPEKAFFWYRKMAEAGSSLGMFNLGIHYSIGRGVQRSFADAIEWMKKAEDAGDDDAPRFIPLFEANAALEKKAAAGDAKAQVEFAEALMRMGMQSPGDTGAGVLAESIEWAKKAAEAGETSAYWLLGLAYEKGRGVDEDTEMAVDCYRNGAELGNMKCMYNLGLFYLQGENVEQDEEKGFELILRSAELGNPPAIYAVGKCYEEGTGVELDLYKAIEWFEKAAQNTDDGEIQHHLALAYQYDDSEGKPIDMERAIYWYGRAAENGHGKSAGMYALWTYHAKLVKAGEMDADAEFQDIIGEIMNRAQNGDEEAMKTFITMQRGFQS